MFSGPQDVEKNLMLSGNVIETRMLKDTRSFDFYTLKASERDDFQERVDYLESTMGDSADHHKQVFKGRQLVLSLPNEMVAEIHVQAARHEVL